MNSSEITASQIRKQLKPYDSPFPWGYKPSKSLAFLDPKYDLLPDREGDLAFIFGQAAQNIVDWFKGKNLVRYADLKKEFLGALWERNRRDCEDISMWAIAEVQKQWSLNPYCKNNPALFRCVIDQEPVDHAVVWGVTKSMRTFLFDFQTFKFLTDQKILAVT